MGKFVLVRDGYNDEADVTDTLQEIQEMLQERYDDDPSYFEHIQHEFKIFGLAEEIPFSYLPARITIDVANAEIPAPLPGESVTDYAKRLVGG